MVIAWKTLFDIVRSSGIDSHALGPMVGSDEQPNDDAISPDFTPADGANLTADEQLPPDIFAV
jgi:hypothetical protein